MEQPRDIDALTQSFREVQRVQCEHKVNRYLASGWTLLFIGCPDDARNQEPVFILGWAKLEEPVHPPEPAGNPSLQAQS
jgi:hypothetical protein